MASTSKKTARGFPIWYGIIRVIASGIVIDKKTIVYNCLNSIILEIVYLKLA